MLPTRLSTSLSVSAVALATLLAGTATLSAQQPAPQNVVLDSTLLSAYHWRNIGPDRGGRSIAVSGVRGQPNVAYFGAAGGGLWKTTDGGENWKPVTDGQITSASVGAVAVSESNPNVVYIGTGESAIRGDIMPGDGIYKSTDAGKTWTHIGFDSVDAISKIRVDPTNPDIVFAAVFGQYSVPSPERGIYKSSDGGKTWHQVLFRNDSTGGIDISIDRNNPKVVYAALWQAYRNEYKMSSGGAGCGLFKSTDGGETWKEITRNPGLPKGIDGRIGVAASRANSNRVYALIENAHGGLFMSNDAGATWKLMNDSHDIRQRAFYYTNVQADPKNEDVVYMENTSLFRSTDAGKTLHNVRGTHGDFHDLWIDPDDPSHLVVGNDGGGAVSKNTGHTWTAEDYPTGQFYHVATTTKIPYDVCGAQQDNTTLCLPYNWNENGGRRRFGYGGGRGGASGGSRDVTAGAMAVSYQVAGGEPGYIAPDPKDFDIFFSGANNGDYIEKYNKRLGTVREVDPYPWFYSGEPSDSIRERWQWTFPILFSPADHTTLYTSSQHLWASTDGGNTWKKLSGDLTRHDPRTMGPSGGPITHDMNGPEVYGTIFAVGPGKKNTNIIWTGSDDGLVFVTRDGGQTWTDVTPPGMPNFGRVSQIDASSFDDGGAYVAVKRPLLNDRSPYIFRTKDYGRTWTKIVSGIPADDYVHAVREDSTREGLLYAATQHGVYISYDDGDSWQDLHLNMPDVPVVDLVVEKNQLVIATHGRGFWVLDNIAPLRQATPGMTMSAMKLFKPPVAVRSGTNVTFSWWLGSKAKSEKLEVLDSVGAVLRTFVPDTTHPDTTRARAAGFRRFRATWLSDKAGLNTLSWNLRAEPYKTFPGMILWGARTEGPAVPPGHYTLRLTADGQTATAPLTVIRNPWITGVTDADMHAQYDFSSAVRDKVTEANEAVIAIRRVKAQLQDRYKRSKDKRLRRAGEKLDTDASAVESEIYQVKNRSGEDPLNFPIKVNNRLATLMSMAERGDGRPNQGMHEIFKILTARLRGYTDQLQHVWATDLVAVNRDLKRLELPTLDPKCANPKGCSAM